jgi:hypothetical protein
MRALSLKNVDHDLRFVLRAIESSFFTGNVERRLPRATFLGALLADDIVHTRKLMRDTIQARRFPWRVEFRTEDMAPVLRAPFAHYVIHPWELVSRAVRRLGLVGRIAARDARAPACDAYLFTVTAGHQCAQKARKQSAQARKLFRNLRAFFFLF